MPRPPDINSTIKPLASILNNDSFTLGAITISDLRALRSSGTVTQGNEAIVAKQVILNGLTAGVGANWAPCKICGVDVAAAYRINRSVPGGTGVAVFARVGVMWN